MQDTFKKHNLFRDLMPQRWIKSRFAELGEDGNILISNFTQIERQYFTFDAQETDLFLEFSALNPEKKQIEIFCYDHGYLGVGKNYFNEEMSMECYGESLQDWKNEISTIKKCIELMKAIEKNDNSLLKRCFKVIFGYNLYVFNDLESQESKKTIEDFIRCEEVSKSTPTIFDIAKYYLTSKIYTNLQGNVDIFLWDKAKVSTTIDLLPRNLKGALWLQIHSALMLGAKLKTCENCGKLMLLGGRVSEFEVRLRAKRTDRLTCGPACRTALSRRSDKKEKVKSVRPPKSRA
jgi:hypothetical protein